MASLAGWPVAWLFGCFLAAIFFERFPFRHFFRAWPLRLYRPPSLPSRQSHHITGEHVRTGPVPRVAPALHGGRGRNEGAAP